MTNKLWDPRRKALQSTLKAARLESGMTQKNLSDLLGKPQSYGGAEQIRSSERIYQFYKSALKLKRQSHKNIYF